MCRKWGYIILSLSSVLNTTSTTETLHKMWIVNSIIGELLESSKSSTITLRSCQRLQSTGLRSQLLHIRNLSVLSRLIFTKNHIAMVWQQIISMVYLGVQLQNNRTIMTYWISRSMIPIN